MFRKIPAEAWPGIALFLAAAGAMLIANSAWGSSHQELLSTLGSVSFGSAAIELPLSSWIKNLLMAAFFFYAGLELKRELSEGALASWSKTLLPLAGAAGGMVFPAALYLAIAGSTYPSGWAIPAATDIAFALGALALLGNRVPPGLKAFLLAVAVVDDLGAILIVALVYSDGIDSFWLAWAGGIVLAMLIANRLNVTAIGVYLLLLVPLWVAMQNSGINPTIAGVLAAAFIPMRDRNGASPLEDVEHAIRPYVLFGIMPVFALASAGAYLGGGIGAAVSHPIALGIAAGLALGKPLGIAGLTIMVGRIMRVPLPGSTLNLLGVGAIAGIGFTMSLFIGALAFSDPALQAPVRVGVYLGSLAAGLAGILLLLVSLPRGSETRPDADEDPSRPFLATAPAYEHDRSPRHPPLPLSHD